MTERRDAREKGCQGEEMTARGDDIEVMIGRGEDREKG